MLRLAALQFFCLTTSMLLLLSVIGRVELPPPAAVFASIGIATAVSVSLTVDLLLIVTTVASIVKTSRRLLIISQRLAIASLMLSIGCGLTMAFVRESMLTIYILCSVLTTIHEIGLFSLTLVLFPDTFVPEFSTPSRNQ